MTAIDSTSDVNATALENQFGVRLVVVHSAVSYKREVRQDDRLIIESEIPRFGNTSFPFVQRILFPDGSVAAQAEVVMVSVDLEGKSVAVPDALRDRLAEPACQR